MKNADLLLYYQHRKPHFFAFIAHYNGAEKRLSELTDCI
ncbi:hypothetical protein yinte0001_27850 [Yersinia intermedia ATCC 29909]|nr:hypothetical protein yinte0001_27850 [Yersinia intermedia ATCC 29909]